MNCYECATEAITTSAVAVCVDCGVALCVEHALATPRSLTRTAAINRVILVEPAARTVRCALCQAAVCAANGQAAGKVRTPDVAAAH